jgi:hypothetical protein
MSESTAGNNSVRKNKRLIGMVAIALLLVFTVLALVGILGFLDWIILDLIVAFAANLLFRRENRKNL